MIIQVNAIPGKKTRLSRCVNNFSWRTEVTVWSFFLNFSFILVIFPFLCVFFLSFIHSFFLSLFFSFSLSLSLSFFLSLFLSLFHSEWYLPFSLIHFLSLFLSLSLSLCLYALLLSLFSRILSLCISLIPLFLPNFHHPVYVCFQNVQSHKKNSFNWRSTTDSNYDCDTMSSAFFVFLIYLSNVGW